MLQRNKLLEHRKRAGLSQEELGQAVGVTRQTIISIEKNKYVPSLPLALKLAKLFKVSVEDLFE